MDYRYGSHTVFQIEYHFVVLRRFVWKLTTAGVCGRCLWSCRAAGSRLDEVHPKGLALTRLHGSHN